MNKLVTELGGHPLTNNDARFIQDSNAEQFLNIAKSLIGEGHTKVKFLGVIVTKVGNDYTHTAGVMLFDGELYTVDALTTALNDTGTPKFDIDLSYPIDNPVNYKNGVPQNVHHIRKLKLVPSTSPTGFAYNDAGIENFATLVKTRLGFDAPAWTPLTLTSLFTNSGGPNKILRIKKDGNFITLVGQITKAVGSAGNDVVIISNMSAYVPLGEVVVPVIIKRSPSTMVPAWIGIGGGQGITLTMLPGGASAVAGDIIDINVVYRID